ASVVAHIDARLPEAAHSSGLLIQATENLSWLPRLQRHRVEAQLAPKLAKLGPPHRLRYSLPLAIGLVLLGLGLQYFALLKTDAPPGTQAPGQIQFRPMDSLAPGTGIPRLVGTTIDVDPPGYTGLPRQRTEDPNIRAVVGSTVRWRLAFQGGPAVVRMDWMGDLHPLGQQGGTYSLQLPVDRAGFYSFSFTDSLGKVYRSELHSLEAVADTPPTIELTGLDHYSQFGAGDDKSMPLMPRFSDDFGLEDAYVVATVSKGSGESVKFREEILRFEGTFPKGSKNTQERRTLDLDRLGMDPGDELYFHIVALDNRRPDPNVARSETYFAQIRDSVGDLFAVEGGMGVDL